MSSLYVYEKIKHVYFFPLIMKENFFFIHCFVVCLGLFFSSVLVFFHHCSFLPLPFLSPPPFFGSASWNTQIGVLIGEDLLSKTQAFLCKIRDTCVCVCHEEEFWEDCGYSFSCCLINATVCAANKCLGFPLGMKRRGSSLCSLSFPRNSWKITVFNISIFPAQMPKSCYIGVMLF